MASQHWKTVLADNTDLPFNTQILSLNIEVAEPMMGKAVKH